MLRRGRGIVKFELFQYKPSTAGLVTASLVVGSYSIEVDSESEP